MKARGVGSLGAGITEVMLTSNSDPLEAVPTLS